MVSFQGTDSNDLRAFVNSAIRDDLIVDELDLRGMLGPVLSESLLELKGLRDLYLGDNQLDELPHWLGRIRGLRMLSLGRNQISALPNMLDCWTLEDSLETSPRALRRPGQDSSFTAALSLL